MKYFSTVLGSFFPPFFRFDLCSRMESAYVTKILLKKKKIEATLKEKQKEK